MLTGFLILGTLGAIGVAILCSYCGLVRGCCRRRRKDRGLSSTERTTEEGLNGDDPQKLVRVNLDEKWSIVPGSPPPIEAEDFVEALPRDAHAHTLSCSTCPPDSLNGVRGGVPGQLAPGWVFPDHRQLANVVPPPQDENTAHKAPPLAFLNVLLEGPTTQPAIATSVDLASVEVQASVPSSGAAPGTTPPGESAIEVRVSSSGDSYMTCDSASKYSMASGRRASGVESVPEDSDRDTSNGDSNTAHADAERPSTPEGSHSSSTTDSPSILTTPEQLNSSVMGVVDVAFQTSPSPSSSPIGGDLMIARSGEAGGREESEWDVVAAYSYGARVEPKGPSVGEMVLR